MNQMVYGGCIGALLLALCGWILNLGMIIGSNQIVSSCDDFGRFKRSDGYYECKRLGAPK